MFYGGADVPLSPLGEQEAIAASKYLQQFQLHRIASSPLSRAMFGAMQVLSNQQGREFDDIFVHDGFRELDRGSWCGKTEEEIGLDLLEQFNACVLSVTPDGGESYPELKERVMTAKRELLDLTEVGRASALVSHLQVTRSILSDALGIPTGKMTQLKVATASITCIDYCTLGGKPVVHLQSFKPQAGLRESKDGAN